MAGTAAQNPPSAQSKVTLAGGRRWATEQLRSEFKAWWSTTKQRSTIPLPALTLKAPPTIPRGAMARWLATRSGHGDFATYRERFNNASAEMLCRCGARKAPLHFFFCRKAPVRHRLQFFQARPMTLEDLLTTAQGAVCMAEWLEETKFFSIPTEPGSMASGP